MLKTGIVLQHAVRGKPCLLVDGARTLSLLGNTVNYPKCGGIDCHVQHRKAHLLSGVSGKVVQRLFTGFSPPHTTDQSNLHTNEKGLSDDNSKQEIPVAVEPQLLHFHSTCQKATIANVSSSFTVIPDFITKAEEEILMKEVEPHLKRLKYEFDHWDDAIHGFREIERSRWSQRASSIVARARATAFPDSCQQLPQTHVLDLAKSGVIKPHVDSVRFCGNIICGLCLLSDAVMRLRHVELKDQIVDVLLRRGSLYIMRDEARYNFSHEVLGEEESFFQGERVVRDRRVSIMSRNQPVEHSTVESPS